MKVTPDRFLTVEFFFKNEKKRLHDLFDPFFFMTYMNVNHKKKTFASPVNTLNHLLRPLPSIK